MLLLVELVRVRLQRWQPLLQVQLVLDLLLLLLPQVLGYYLLLLLLLLLLLQLRLGLLQSQARLSSCSSFYQGLPAWLVVQLSARQHH
jgi:hypothetical protein